MCADEEWPSAWRSEWRRARREHRCCACGETVRVGDRYRDTWGVWSGDVDTMKHCARCWTLLQELDALGLDPVMRLDCGETLESVGVVKRLSPEKLLALHTLAFMTKDEAQALVRPT